MIVFAQEITEAGAARSSKSSSPSHKSEAKPSARSPSESQAAEAGTVPKKAPQADINEAVLGQFNLCRKILRGMRKGGEHAKVL